MSDRRIKVLALAGDPGGAEAIAPVISALKQDPRFEANVYSYKQATSIFERDGLRPQCLEESTSIGEFRSILSKTEIQLVLAGTSLNGIDLEKRLLHASNDLRIRSLSILDFWSNYTARFSDSSGTPILPDLIAVPDDRAYTQCLQAGLPEENLIVTGTPAFDKLATWSRESISKTRKRVRASLGVEKTTLLVVFASQPLSALQQAIGYPPPSITEHDAFQLLVDSLPSIASGSPFQVVVKCHPRESHEIWHSHLIDARRGIKAALDTNHSTLECCLAADLVVGMHSVVLLEAALLGVNVVSIQPGDTSNSTLPSRSNIFLVTSTDRVELCSVIRLSMSTPNQFTSGLATSTPTVLKALNQLCELPTIKNNQPDLQ